MKFRKVTFNNNDYGIVTIDDEAPTNIVEFDLTQIHLVENPMPGMEVQPSNMLLEIGDLLYVHGTTHVYDGTTWLCVDVVETNDEIFMQTPIKSHPGRVYPRADKTIRLDVSETKTMSYWNKGIDGKWHMFVTVEEGGKVKDRYIDGLIVDKKQWDELVVPPADCCIDTPKTESPHKYNKSLNIMEKQMNDQDTLLAAKTVIKDVMIHHLFEPIDRITFSSMEKMIIDRLIDTIDIDFSVDVDLYKDDDVKVKLILYWNDDIHKDTVITASYADCPVFFDGEKNERPVTKESEKEIKFRAFDDAMGVV